MYKDNIDKMRIYLIQANQTEKHMKLFYDIRYSKDINNVCKDKIIPDYDNHILWYRKQNLNNMYLIYYKTDCIGYVRIDNNNYLSITIIKKMQNKGIGTYIISRILQRYYNINVEIKQDNIKSKTLFNKFNEINITYIN